ALVGIPGASRGEVHEKESKNVASVDASQKNAVTKTRSMIVQSDNSSWDPIHQEPDAVTVSGIRAGKVGSDVAGCCGDEAVYFWIGGARTRVRNDRAGLRTGHERGRTKTRDGK